MGSQATWTDNVLNFADALAARAALRGYEPFRPECRADIEYLRKAAELLELVTRQYIRLSEQIHHLYQYDVALKTAATEAIEIVKNQENLQKVWPEPEHEPPHN